ncbi:MarR family winged helix-turn-helix transcriptional regulator [Bacillus sp. Marseille-P3661]|uniref:MarR family winged helix-turn-helix transcriptional regulator n=1 Tax=Bacillus sp. Marseille-P3661 TaxID=1936234 RepID=UPI000C858F37|nr:MarR family transcriptional regulator [Bacillus sp. Marseille-P3661]
MEIIRDRRNWFGSLFRRISLNLTNMADHKMAIHGLTSSDYWILKLLWEKDGMTQKELVNQLSVKPASLTGMIDKLVDKGWIIRSADSKDARIKRIFLTKEGKELEYTAADMIVECEETITMGLSDSEKRILKIALKKVLDNLEMAQKN